MIATYEYDGLDRRAIEAPAWAPTTYYLHHFYNASWQMLEMRSTTTENAQPESCWVAFQYVWSARYSSVCSRTGTRCCLPSRITVTVTSSPGCLLSMTVNRSSTVRTSLSSTATIRSPAKRSIRV